MEAGKNERLRGKTNYNIDCEDSGNLRRMDSCYSGIDDRNSHLSAMVEQMDAEGYEDSDGSDHFWNIYKENSQSRSPHQY